MNEKDWNFALGSLGNPLADIKDWMLPPYPDWMEEKMRKTTNLDYKDFLKRKLIDVPNEGISIVDIELNPMLFDFQKDIVKWCLKKGKSAVFTMTGTGKTLIQCEWAKHIHNHTKGKIIIYAPLAVSYQTIREAKTKLGIEVNHCKEKSDLKDGINITNYDRIYKFNPKDFCAIVIDESSILKSLDGKIKTTLIEDYKFVPYKLACTATPAPNDYMELGNHAEFLNVMNYSEMLSMFFVHDGAHTQKWRLKGHAEEDFWDWIAKWSVVLTKPSDLGYEDNDFILPKLNIHNIKTISDFRLDDSYLFPVEAETLQERQKARRKSIPGRLSECEKIVNKLDEPCLVWCDYNLESSELKRRLHHSVEIKGSDSNEHKEKAMIDFTEGKIKVLVTKPSIAGFGMNWQHCSKVVFFGLSDSFEKYFQAVRRCWRFGQKKPVDVYIITSNLEGNIVANIKRKEENVLKLIENMVERTKDTISKNIKELTFEKTKYQPTIKMELPSWLT